MNPPRLPHTPMSARYLDTPIGEKVREIIDGFGFTQPKAKTVSAGTRTVTFSLIKLMAVPLILSFEFKTSPAACLRALARSTPR